MRSDFSLNTCGQPDPVQKFGKKGQDGAIQNCCPKVDDPKMTFSDSVRSGILYFCQFKENLHASKPSDQSKSLGGNIGCRDKNLYMVLKGFPNVCSHIEPTV